LQNLKTPAVDETTSPSKMNSTSRLRRFQIDIAGGPDEPLAAPAGNLKETRIQVAFNRPTFSHWIRTKQASGGPFGASSAIQILGPAGPSSMNCFFQHQRGAGRASDGPCGGLSGRPQSGVLMSPLQSRSELPVKIPRIVN
jgi:hypothetical protein